ncbi:hypothetical protein [Methylophaga sp.]|uniref:hypothetical protein n=1 Tax=Methylophaga sp. TaxID=2024840 RepID=UPI00271DCE40|nr:hypothetical protein [Methylophaga sp.]MDO8827253.1 hypothetical protein [Methylophaga sp.]
MSSNNKEIVLQPANIVAHVEGHWLRRYAEDFLAAARAFKAPNNRFSPVRYYLICHSIELALKAYLFTAGYKKKDRKKLNHDLVEALIAAEKNGLSEYFQITLKERESVEKANALYPKKEFEYFESLKTIYDPHEFDLDVLDELAQRLIEKIEEPIKATFFE